MKAFPLVLLLAGLLAALTACVPQELMLSERIRIRAALESGADCDSIERMDAQRLVICAEERDRLRLEALARNLPPGMEPFDPRDAFLCLYPPTVQRTPWSEPEAVPGFVCRAPAFANGWPSL